MHGSEGAYMVQRGIKMEGQNGVQTDEKAQSNGRGFKRAPLLPYMVLWGYTWLLWVIQSKRAQIRTKQINKLGHTKWFLKIYVSYTCPHTPQYHL